MSRHWLAGIYIILLVWSSTVELNNFPISGWSQLLSVIHITHSTKLQHHRLLGCDTAWFSKWVWTCQWKLLQKSACMSTSQRQRISLKCWYLSTKLHSVTFCKITILTELWISNIKYWFTSGNISYTKYIFMKFRIIWGHFQLQNVLPLACIQECGSAWGTSYDMSLVFYSYCSNLTATYGLDEAMPF